MEKGSQSHGAPSQGCLEGALCKLTHVLCPRNGECALNRRREAWAQRTGVLMGMGFIHRASLCRAIWKGIDR